LAVLDPFFVERGNAARRVQRPLQEFGFPVLEGRLDEVAGMEVSPHGQLRGRPVLQLFLVVGGRAGVFVGSSLMRSTVISYWQRE
jgi:hypothetical protein